MMASSRKEKVFGTAIVTGILSLLGAIIGSCIMGYYQLQILETRNSYKFVELYSKNMSTINNCQDELRSIIIDFSEKSKDHINYTISNEFKRKYYECNNSINNLIYISNIVEAKIEGLNCYSELLKDLNDKFNEILHTFSFKHISIEEMDPLVANQNIKWEHCQDIMAQEYSEFSKK